MSTSKPMTEAVLRTLEYTYGKASLAEVRRLLNKAKRDLDTLSAMNPKAQASYAAQFVAACRQITDEARKAVGTNRVAEAFRERPE